MPTCTRVWWRAASHQGMTLSSPVRRWYCTATSRRRWTSTRAPSSRGARVHRHDPLHGALDRAQMLVVACSQERERPDGGFTASFPGQEPLGSWPINRPRGPRGSGPHPGRRTGSGGRRRPRSGARWRRYGAQESAHRMGGGRRAPRSSAGPRGPPRWRARGRPSPSNQSQPGARLERPRGLPATATTRSPRPRPAAAAGPPLRTWIRLNAVCWCSVRPGQHPAADLVGAEGAVGLCRAGAARRVVEAHDRRGAYKSLLPGFELEVELPRCAVGERDRRAPRERGGLHSPGHGGSADCSQGPHAGPSDGLPVDRRPLGGGVLPAQTSAGLGLAEVGSDPRIPPPAASFFFPSESGRRDGDPHGESALPTARISSPRTSARGTVLLPVSSAGAFSARRSARPGAARVKSARGKGRSQRMARAYRGPASLIRP